MKNTTSNLTNGNFPGEDEVSVDDVYSCPPFAEETAIGNAAKITALSTIMATSFIGNILIIYVTRQTRSMRKIAYSFVVNMAIADLCTTIINMPESLTVEIRNTDEWLPGDVGVVLCKLLPICQQVCAFCSILSLLSIALDRFFAICLPFKRIMTPRLSKVIILFTWLIPLLSSAPMFVANNVVEIEGLTLCIEEWPAPFDNEKAPTDYTIILFVVFYLLPLIIIWSLYSCVVFKLWRRRVPGNYSSTRNPVYFRSRRKALKMFIAIVVCFALLWLPYHVIFFLISYKEEYYYCGLPGDIYFVSSFFSHAISALNPFIYMTLNEDYRRGIKRLLASCFCEKLSVQCLEINTANGVNEDQQMTFYSCSLRFGIWSFLQSKIEPSAHDPPRHGGFVLNHNQGFVSKDEA